MCGIFFKAEVYWTQSHGKKMVCCGMSNTLGQEKTKKITIFPSVLLVA